MVLEFRRIDLAQDADTCVRFRRDAYACSFGDLGRFDRECGVDGEIYLNWLAEKAAEFAQGFVHVWLGDRIVGQIEMRPRGQPPIGYVNLLYLVPELRGSGAGELLHEYAVDVFRKEGLSKLQLSVSSTNERAIAFYRKFGWEDRGPRDDHPEVNVMERRVALGRTGWPVT